MSEALEDASAQSSILQQRVNSQGNPESDIKQKPPKKCTAALQRIFMESSTCDCHSILIDISTCNTSRGISTGVNQRNELPRTVTPEFKYLRKCNTLSWTFLTILGFSGMVVKKKLCQKSMHNSVIIINYSFKT